MFDYVKCESIDAKTRFK